jgi:hypothetical protein
MVTIDHSQVIEPLSDFPVYIQTVDIDLKDHAQSDGDDILFMDGTGVAHRLWHEIETYDPNTGSLVAWVHLPSIGIINDTVFYLYYGNTAMSSQQFPTQVWDDPYQAVWHLNNNPTGTIVDSTINNNDGTSHGDMTLSDLADGKLGKCLEFDGSDDYISLQSVLNGQSGTIEAWINVAGDGDRCILTKGQSFSNDAYFMFIVSSSDNVGFYSRSVGYGAGNKVYGNTDVSSGWHHVVGISNGILWSVYVDGHLESLSIIGGSNNGEWFSDFSGDTYSIGVLDRPDYYSFYRGYIDEVHVLNMVKTNGWIATEYSNQNDPAGFMSFGVEEPGL